MDTATLFNEDDESVLQFDMKAGNLSVPRSLLGEHLAPAVTGPMSNKNFTAVEWGVGDKRITTPMSALTLLNVTFDNKLYLCSDSAKLAGAVNASMGHDAGNRTEREVVEQGSLDCGTLASESFCIVGQPPLHWSAGGRAVLVAAYWTPRFSFNTTNKMLVCAQIGRLLLVTQSDAASSQAPTPGTMFGAGVACGVVTMGFGAALAIYMRTRTHKNSKGAAES